MCNKEKFLDDLRSLVGIESVRTEEEDGAPFGKNCALALSEALAICGRLGLETENISNRVGVAYAGEGEVKLAILAHLDVVPAGGGWSTAPFTLEVDDKNIYGRGVADDKGPALAAIYALAEAKRLCPGMKSKCAVILGTAEETGGDDIGYYFREKGVPPMVFTPDADYPVINTEKGRYAPIFEGKYQSDFIEYFCGGDTVNAVPGTAVCVLRNVSAGDAESAAKSAEAKTGASITVTERDDASIVLECAGKRAHGAFPENGCNAVTALLCAVCMLNVNDDLLDCLRALSLSVPHGDVNGKCIGISVMDELSGALTLNFGTLKYENNVLSGSFDIRYPVCCDGEMLRRVVDNELSSDGLNVKSFSYSRAHHVPEDSVLVSKLLDVWEEFTGKKGSCLSTGGGTYVHDIPTGVAFGCTMPGVDNHMHGPDEFMSLDDLMLSIKMFTRIITDLCA